MDLPYLNDMSDKIINLLKIKASRYDINHFLNNKGQWRGALMFYLIYVWINGWLNYREAGDLRRHAPIMTS